jgi:hypothetical protein
VYTTLNKSGGSEMPKCANIRARRVGLLVRGFSSAIILLEAANKYSSL